MTDAVRELIHRYIDQVADPAEVGQVNDLLTSDPQAADAFAELTRFDSLLSLSLCSTPLSLPPLGPLPSPAAPIAPMDKQPGRDRSRSLWLVSGVAASIALAVLLFLFANTSREAPSVVSGRVLVDGKPARVIPLGRPVEIVGAEPAVFRLDDASQAILEPNSQGSIQAAADGERQMVRLSHGAGTFKVTHGQGRFQVVTPVATITALGTEFRVGLKSRRAGPASKQAKLVALVSVTDGEVQVDAGGESYRVAAGGPSRAFGDDGEQNNVDDGDQNNSGQNQGDGNQGNGNNGQQD